MKMKAEIDHYLVLGLPSGEEGAKLTKNEISKAYKLKALELHPDKRPNDPNANAEFQTLSSSYEFLTNDESRREFDDLLRAEKKKKQDDELKRELGIPLQFGGSRCRKARKRRRSSTKGDNQEPGFVEPDFEEPEHEEPEDKELKKVISDILLFMEASEEERVENIERILKVRWAGNGTHYSSERLRELFSEFGRVEDVIIPLKKCGKIEQWCAFVVMESKDDAYVAMRCVYGDLSNPLLVLPVYKKLPADSVDYFTAETHKQPFEKKYKQQFGKTFSLFR